MNVQNKLDQGIAKLGLEIGSDTNQKLITFLTLLKKWNRVYNLTAIRDHDQMLSHHVLDSMAVLPYLYSGNWMDVGCGAGLPGLVLALMRPDWQFTLVDSNGKKMSFVQQVAIELELKNIKVCCARVEDVRTDLKFDGIISRAFAATEDFVKSTRHLLADSGRWLAMKGTPDKELRSLSGDVEVERIIPISVPGLNAARCLVILKVK